MGHATGFPVMRLARTSFAGITHDNLRPGEFRPLTVDELLELRKSFGVPKRVRGAVVDGHQGHHLSLPSRKTRPVTPPRDTSTPSRDRSPGVRPGAKARDAAHGDNTRPPNPGTRRRRGR